MSGGATPQRAVLRPRRARLVVYGCASALVSVLIAIALLLPSEGAHAWGPASRAGVIAFALLCGYFLHRLADVKVVTDAEGATVVNVVTRRRLEWAEVVGVRLARDDPWMMLDVSDGSSLAAMGVQKSEGARATEQMLTFRRMVEERSQPPEGGRAR